MLKILDREINRGDKFITDYQVTDGQGGETLLPYYVIAGEQDGPRPLHHVRRPRHGISGHRRQSETV